MVKENIGDYYEAIMSRLGLGIVFRSMKKVRRLEKKTGTDFWNSMSQKEAGFEAEKGNEYAPCTKGIVKIVKHRIGKNDVFLDIGCGKGYALYLMGKQPFKRIIGVEISTYLANIAKDNLLKIYENDNRFNIFAVDALTMLENEDSREALCDANYVYINNSFPNGLVEPMLSVLQKSLILRPREMTLLYHHPNDIALSLLMGCNALVFKKKWRIDSRNIYEFYSII